MRNWREKARLDVSITISDECTIAFLCPVSESEFETQFSLTVFAGEVMFNMLILCCKPKN